MYILRKYYVWISFCTALIFPLQSLATDVTMAFGDNLPPYIMASSDSGLEIDIVKEALAYRGHHLIPKYFPMARIPYEFINQLVDAIMIDVGQDMKMYGGHYGVAPILYNNVFITLKSKHINIRTPKDLVNLKIISFVGAAKRYPDWLKSIEHSQGYDERNNQSSQPLLLNLERYDVVLSDREIFQYYSKKHAKDDSTFKMPDIDVHVFVQPNPLDYRPVFRNKIVRDDFNAGLEYLRNCGRYQEIIHKYLLQK